MTTNITKYSKSVVGLVLLIVCGLALQAAELPAGWLLMAKDREAYEIGTDLHVLYKGAPSLYLKGKEPMPKVAGLAEFVPAEKYAGERVRFSAVTRTEGVEGGAQLVFHVNRDKGPMIESIAGPIRGNSGWQNYAVVVDVPQDAINMNVGVALAGQGTVWLNDVKIEIVGSDVPTSTPTEARKGHHRRTRVSCLGNKEAVAR